MQSRLPSWLASAVESRLQGVSGRALAAAYAGLSAAYRQGLPTQPGADEGLHWLAYLTARMPATFAAVEAALLQLPAGLLASCESLLDLGSGPGTATWAASSVHPGLKRSLGLERSPGAVSLASSLALEAPLQASFQRADLPSALAAAPEADLVILAYSLGEIGSQSLSLAFSKAKKLLLIVEPGTPQGFGVILGARDTLPGLVAPCPQSGPCPLAAGAGPLTQGKWCHFSARLERNRMAKLLKGGELGYEDEKFSYAAFTPTAAAGAMMAKARILGRPAMAGREVRLELCAPEGIKEIKVTKADKAAHKKARKAEWGEAWP